MAETPQDSVTIDDFSKAKAESNSWYAVNDGVMGGLSQGGVSFENAGILKFAGTLSLENNGGFSSIRKNVNQAGLEAGKGLKLRVKGDGRDYDLRLTTSDRFRYMEISYRAKFKTTADEWTTVEIPFSQLKPSVRGRALDGPQFNPGQTESIGLILADKVPGDFQIEIDWIELY
ncbi:CIA30 family protein [Rubellicoccus peritrichatus]|uniref:CIA30 family protein n=1 Tax=Rubellicoccus peritrichatus TaxID=3080537 RepID=A0AAQ3LB68_9BACT|nr:CIA30 family protein [Puniceicoccus sp. CR14]WOO40705.1 CIA30 family protein [Puniceicoccus sp. CR14]